MYSSTMNLDGVLVVSIIILVFVSSISFAQECANNQGGIELTTQPMDATVCLGGTAYFSCDYTGTRSRPQWIINSTLYTSSNLPLNTRYDGDSRMLIVSDVTEEQVDVTYQCFLALFNPVNDSICLILSSIGKLKVNTSVVPIDIRQAAEEVCITCLPGNSNIPTDYYSVTISDISGSEIHGATVSNPTCISVGTAFQFPQCAPFVVSVKAINYSGNAIAITLDEKGGDICSCVKKRVFVDLDITISIEKFQINLLCYRIDYVSGAQFDVEINYNGSTPISVNCSGDTLEFTGLDCNYTYNISVYWRSPINDNVRCLIDQRHRRSTQCEHKDVVSESLWLTFLVLSVVLGSLTIILCMITVVLYIPLRRRYVVNRNRPPGNANVTVENHERIDQAPNAEPLLQTQ